MGLILYEKGIDLGNAYDIPKNMQNMPFFPAVCMKNAEILFNFGEKSFKHAPQVLIYYLFNLSIIF